jgi:hypothetical protein
VTGDGCLEPGPGSAGRVEHGGVGNLQLGDREGPVEAVPTVVEGQRVGHDPHHPRKQVTDMSGAEASADAVRDSMVIDGS